jgi:predicted lipoprotein with Yx(FWY)xxD motif
MGISAGGESSTTAWSGVKRDDGARNEAAMESMPLVAMVCDFMVSDGVFE